jgi:8-oxo-dGTP pyrophosphatase MutT (NUDIX family)
VLLWRLIHNMLVHPLLGLAPKSRLVEGLHTWTAHRGYPQACLVVLVRHGLVLGIERGNVEGAWGLPGGKRERGESRRACAARELREETGVVVAPERLTEVHRDFVDGFDTTTFTVDEFEGVPRSSDEGGVRWISWDTLLGGSFSAYNRGVRTRL